MRLSLRFVVPLLLALGAFAYIAVPLADSLMLRWFVRDIDIRSNMIASTVQEPLTGLILTGSTPRIASYFNRMLLDERLYAVGLCLDGQAAPITTAQFPPEIQCASLDTYAEGSERLGGSRRQGVDCFFGAHRGVLEHHIGAVVEHEADEAEHVGRAVGFLLVGVWRQRFRQQVLGHRFVVVNAEQLPLYLL